MKSILFDSVRQIVAEARLKTYRSVNSILLKMYWDIGRLIVEDEQHGKVRAEYGKAVLRKLSRDLTMEFGKGFDFTNLTNMKKFYLAFPKLDALRHELSRAHYRIISRLENQQVRDGYVQLVIEGNWNTRELQRNIDSIYLGRILEVKREDAEITEPKNLIKDEKARFR